MPQREENIKRVRETFAQRLRNARKMRGLSHAELAEMLSGLVSRTAIEKYEKAAMFPQNSSIISAFAKVLNIPVGDLLRPIRVNINSENFEFRKKSKLGKKAQETIIAKINHRIEKYFEIEEILNVRKEHKLNLTVTNVKTEIDARKLANEIRHMWKLDNRPIPQPIQLLEGYGVIVIEVEENPELFDGTSNTVGGKPVIVINERNKDDNNPDEERRRLTLFHEYGHQVMSELFDKSLTDKERESLCNVFANEMLITSEAFIKRFKEKRQHIILGELKSVQRIYGISSRALMMKARQLGVITENYYRSFCIALNQNKQLKDFVDSNVTPQLHSERFQQMVYQACAMEIVTESKAAELLGISVSDLKDDMNFS